MGRDASGMHGAGMLERGDSTLHSAVGDERGPVAKFETRF